MHVKDGNPNVHGCRAQELVQISEVVFGIPFLAAIALQLAVPLSLPRGLLTPGLILGALS